MDLRQRAAQIGIGGITLAMKLRIAAYVAELRPIQKGKIAPSTARITQIWQVKMNDNYKIIKYYQNLGYQEAPISYDLIENRYLSGLISNSELEHKVILEVGAGASQYRDYSLYFGIEKYIGVELISDRIPASPPENQYYNRDFLEFLQMKKLI